MRRFFSRCSGTFLLTSRRAQHIQLLHRSILSNADARSIQTCTRATSRLGERLVELRASEESLLAGAQLSSVTRFRAPSSMEDTNSSSTFTPGLWGRRMRKSGRPVST